jgi:outer membrane protein
MRPTFRAASVALGLTALSTSAYAQQPFKIAFVNTQQLMDVAPGRASADSALQKVGEGFKVQLQKMQDSINALLSDYQKKEPTLSAAQKDSRQKAIQGLETEYQAKNIQFQQQFAQKQNELFAPISEAVKKVLDDVRTEDGYSMILANDPGQSAIISADKNLDITDRVVARLRTVAATTKNNPAQKPGAAPQPAGVTSRPPVRPPAQ